MAAIVSFWILYVYNYSPDNNDQFLKQIEKQDSSRRQRNSKELIEQFNQRARACVCVHHGNSAWWDESNHELCGFLDYSYLRINLNQNV